jgi:pyruvate, water dikinase
MRIRLPWRRPERFPSSEDGLERIRSLLSKFQRIQRLNTKFLELMAGMDRALGGEYIFDRAFLESSVREITDHVYQVVYSLNALSQNRHLSLFDRYLHLKATLEDILSGGFGPLAASLTIPYANLGLEMEPLAGLPNVCLAEAGHRLGLSAPDGFAVTVSGCRLFLDPTPPHTRQRLPSDRVALESSLAGTPLPQALEEALWLETDALRSRRGESIRLTVRACAAGRYGLAQPNLPGIRDVPPADVPAACKRAMVEYAVGSDDWGTADFAVALAVHEDLPLRFAGTASVMESTHFPAGEYLMTAAPAGSPEKKERYRLRRNHPFDLLESEILPKSAGDSLSYDPWKLLRLKSGLHRGSAFVAPAFLRSVAHAVTTIERLTGIPHELHWGKDNSESPVVLNVGPVYPTGETGGGRPENLPDDLHNAEVLLRGGDTAQGGVAAGRAVHVSEDDPPDGFPYGAVAVARKASPRLSLLLRRASALITEVGTPVGHLAAIARELRVPAIFGAADALRLIPEGMEVTVDAGDHSVYKGSVDALLSSTALSPELFPSDPEYIMLRGLLRWITPLNLIDPEAEDFTAENCRTCHDIIHFAHERSVEELINIQDRHRALGNLKACRLKLDAPIEIFVLDLDGGVCEAKAEVEIGVPASEPLDAFVKGLTCKDIWNSGSVSIGLRDILSGMDRSFAALNNPPEYTGRNLVVLAGNYMNLSLHLGYHSSIVDAFLSDNPNQNTIYFRFVGGFADEDRRKRRIVLMNRLLEEAGFKTTVRGDLVVARLKLATRDEMVSGLVFLGQLTGFTRQLDTSISSEGVVEELVKVFKAKTTRSRRSEGSEGDAGA